MGIKLIADNRKARFNYEILEKLEVGLALRGSEVKSLREGRANLTDGYARFDGGGGKLHGVHISPYTHGGYANHEAVRPRGILLHAHELKRWLGKLKTKGLTVVPLKLYFNDRGLVKCELGLAKGKKIHDKRETIRRREMDREARSAMKRHRMD